MRLIFSSILALLILGAFAQCKSKKKKADNRVVTAASSDQKLPENMRAVKINPDYTWPGETDPFQIISSSVAGNTLKLQVQYGGGCETHDFNMYTNMRWLKSQPPQLNLYLEHNSHGDKCRAMITEELYFDLSALKTEQSNSIRLIINNNRENMISYSY